MFDPHFAGVIGKGTLLPLNSSALPPGTIILRQSQVKMLLQGHQVLVARCLREGLVGAFLLGLLHPILDCSRLHHYRVQSRHW